MKALVKNTYGGDPNLSGKWVNIIEFLGEKLSCEFEIAGYLQKFNLELADVLEIKQYENDDENKFDDRIDAKSRAIRQRLNSLLRLKMDGVWIDERSEVLQENYPELYWIFCKKRFVVEEKTNKVVTEYRDFESVEEAVSFIESKSPLKTKKILCTVYDTHRISMWDAEGEICPFFFESVF